ncbi:MAG: hypothetical protein MAG715_00492 [Methanonatronarchaeales archaeon]|nr:hypothetical protein [Methanonatronarchaeales archaeon]
MITKNVLLAAMNDSKKFKKRVYLDLFRNLQVSQDDGVEDVIRKVGEMDFDPKVVDKLVGALQGLDLDWYVSELDRLSEKGVKFAPFYGEEYPGLLAKIEDPPLGLYVRGEYPVSMDGVAVVGSRSSPEDRKDFAYEVGEFLVKKGFLVVSGLAKGIDEKAHEGAMDAGGYTVASLPGHIEKVYPSSNEGLAERITEHGALLSEVSRDTAFGRWRFLERNRITSGVSRAVIVVASRHDGGTVHQAEIALREGRPVFMYAPDGVGECSPKEIERKGADLFRSTEELGEYLEDLDRHFSGNYQATLA